MAKTDRCEICDYIQTEGSEYADVGPGHAGQVRHYAHRGQYLCRSCLGGILEVMNDYFIDDLNKELENVGTVASSSDKPLD